MTVVKKSVAFDENVAREAMELAGEGEFSAFVNETVALRLQWMRIDAYLDELEAEFGPVPPEIQREVDAEWDALLNGRP